jgi:hypothetical protein
MARPSNQLSEARVPLTMPASMKAALDRFCADRSRAAGHPVTRGEVIREAIVQMLPLPKPQDPT